MSTKRIYVPVAKWAAFQDLVRRCEERTTGREFDSATWDKEIEGILGFKAPWFDAVYTCATVDDSATATAEIKRKAEEKEST